MRHLYLLRHAKSDWSAELTADFDRPLAPRGRRAAGTVGRFLTAIRQVPDAVVTSPAVRARSTVEVAAEAGGWRCPVATAEQLYSGSTEQLLTVVREVDDGVLRLLLAGHEPTWSESVGRLIGSGRVRMVTAAVARVDLPVDCWAEAAFGTGTLAWLCTPKLLRRFASPQESR